MNIIQKIIAELRKAVQGKDQVLVWILMTILADGNVLLEDIPGVGKTTIALAFSRALGLERVINRIDNPPYYLELYIANTIYQ